MRKFCVHNCSSNTLKLHKVPSFHFSLNNDQNCHFCNLHTCIVVMPVAHAIFLDSCCVHLGIEIENVALNHSIHIYDCAIFQNNFNSSVLIPMPLFLPNLLPINLMDAILVAFYFMITELTGVGYS